MLRASCHCGAVEIALPEEPRWQTSCNCSVCRRLGTRWIYYHPRQVSFVEGAGKTIAYVWGDGTLEFHHCPTCGRSDLKRTTSPPWRGLSI
ncbi:GFA family protein [Chelativorans sp. YIM 93263]|uniref:GFA family protein n=1 Tax=Chelativorans sp. YIM 93263 TaxID=2906648 RepID=UPI00403DAA3A